MTQRVTLSRYPPHLWCPLTTMILHLYLYHDRREKREPPLQYNSVQSPRDHTIIRTASVSTCTRCGASLSTSGTNKTSVPIHIHSFTPHTHSFLLTCMGKRSRKLPPTISGSSGNTKATTAQPEQDPLKQLLLNIQLEESSGSDTNDFQDSANNSHETTNVKRRARTGHFQKAKKKQKGYVSSEPSLSKSSPAANPTEFVTNGVRTRIKSGKLPHNWWQINRVFLLRQHAYCQQFPSEPIVLDPDQVSFHTLQVAAGYDVQGIPRKVHSVQLTNNILIRWLMVSSR